MSCPDHQIILKGTMTLAGTKEVDGKTYLIIKSDLQATMTDMVATFKMPPGGPGASAAPPQYTFNGTIKQMGTILFDEQAGQVFNSTENRTVDMQMVMSGSPQVNKINTNIDIQISLTQ